MLKRERQIKIGFVGANLGAGILLFEVTIRSLCLSYQEGFKTWEMGNSRLGGSEMLEKFNFFLGLGHN